MAGNQMISDSFSSNFANMSKTELYDIMSRMKILTEQNPQQARKILIDNPALAKALFQAQIMLGMVQSSQGAPTIQPPISQAPQQSVQPTQPVNIQAQALPVQISQQDHTSAVDIHIPARKQQANHPVPKLPPASVPPVTHQSQTPPSHSLQSMQQARGHMGTQGMSMSHSQSSQVHSMPRHPHHSAQQSPPFHQSQVPSISSQSQQSLHISGSQHQPMQPPLQPWPRPPPVQPFQHQHHSQMGPHVGFQNSGASQPHLSQPPFSAGNRHPGSIGFPQGQLPMPNQPPPQPLYQGGGSHLGNDFSSHGGVSMHMDRPPWLNGPPENSMGGAQHPGQMGLGMPPPPPPQLTPEMEQTLLQQVMSLTPEQMSLLPPEQRHQVLQLQQMLR